MDENFRLEYQTDPYTAAITNMVIDGWAMGYEAARREIERGGSADQMREQSFSDLRERAAKELLDAGREAEQRAIRAMAALGRMNPDLLRWPPNG